MGLFDLPGKKREVTTRRKNVAHSKNGTPFVRREHPMTFWGRPKLSASEKLALKERKQRLKNETRLTKAQSFSERTNAKATRLAQKTNAREVKGRTGLIFGTERGLLARHTSNVHANEQLEHQRETERAHTRVANRQLDTQLAIAKHRSAAEVNYEKEREQALRAERIEQAKHSAKLRDREIEVRNRNVALREKLAGIEARQAPTPDEIAGEQEARFLATAEAAGLTPKQLADAIKAQGGREAVLAAVGRTEMTNAIATGVPVHDGEFARPAPPRARSIKKDAEGNPVANGPLWAQ
jgi:hypothetical protein